MSLSIFKKLHHADLVKKSGIGSLLRCNRYATIVFMNNHHQPRWQQRLNNYQSALSQLESAVALSSQRHPSDLEKQVSVISHWGIENRCHWVLDVVFAKDRSSVVEGHAPENLRALNILAGKMLKEEKSCRKGIRAKQFKAALDND